MENKRKILVFNSLAGEKQEFKPIQEGRIGMYVCGPTVYSNAHLGNCRTYVSFDVIFRFLKHLGYSVRYVRNITDVGHLLDDGEDRMLKGARLEQLEPMEIAQKYANGFHEMMRIFNIQNPSIEPLATGHIIEQIEMVKEILERGFAYEKNGSVYFNTIRYIQSGNPYGELSGRVVEDLMAESRDNLKNQDEKNHPSDFAIWMKASDEHIMKWPSPWSVGFPGWHLECSAMSKKYLGEQFDIHGGGNDLKFPHHENEIAQSVGSCGHSPANYWLHTNMLLLNGRKMSKSEGNTISPEQLFTGESKFISKAYSPMSVRFFMLQAHYRSTLDITDEGLQAGEKGFKRLMDALATSKNVQPELSSNSAPKDELVSEIIEQIYSDLCDDFNAPKAIANLFEMAGLINSIANKQIASTEISQYAWEKLKDHFSFFIIDILGLKDESSEANENTTNGLMQLIIELRKDVRERKDWAGSDKIRDGLKELGIQLKDGKEGTDWSRI
ncbi:MAG TPA: cysteine--tRNA ligase [Saprospiraceae bacterium]|nr:cysteine--tRNA ligase [Saprospiraceae bacterium]